MSHTYEFPMAALTADVVALWAPGSPVHVASHVLLIRRKFEPYKGMWALPGGFLDASNTGEAPETAAKREFKEETGLCASYLVPLPVRAGPGRDPRSRVVDFPYLWLCDWNVAPLPKAGDDAIESEWFALHRLPKLAFDHTEIIQSALHSDAKISLHMSKFLERT